MAFEPLQIWNVGSVLCDTIIAVCMTYYVGLEFLPFVFEEQSDLIPCLRWQLSRFDTIVKETQVLLKKIIRLTIETGSLTGA